MNPVNFYPVSLISALTALVASILSPFVTLSVARWQFRANVLSSNRQKWNDTFRDGMAELLARITAAHVAKRTAIDEWRGGEGPIAADPALADKLEKIFMAIAQIRLLTKAEEPEHKALNEAISAALGYLQNNELREHELMACMEEITKLARSIIRTEWARVKRGV
jgi:hypothetical protein